jgi:hypothetical protein
MKNLLKKAETKTDQLDWQLFNFIENLLVFCANPSRSARQEIITTRIVYNKGF